jgi:hypothetical protein
MRQRVARGWTLLGKSWDLVRRDRRLLVFPALSTVGMLLATAGIFLLTGHFGWSSRSCDMRPSRSFSRTRSFPV